MRILQVYKDVFPEVSGGIERYMNDLACFLQSRGHSVEIIVSGGGERQVNGIPVHGVPQLCRLLSNPVAPGFTGYLRNTDADVVHFHLPLPAAVLSWQAGASRKPWVVTYHSDIVRQAFAMPFYAPFLRRFLLGASAVLATSRIYMETSPYLCTLPNVSVVPIGVNSERFAPALEPTRGFYLFVGRFRRYKGIFTLLEAWRKLADPPPLVMAGGGKMKKEIESLIEKHSLPIKLRTDVSDSELVGLYGNAKALILPSTLRSEAFGMVQLEAMACGTPVISSDLPTGVSWVNFHGETGLLFKTGSPGSLAEAVTFMENNESFRKKAGLAARERAVSMFDSRTMFRKVEECLLSAAES